MSKTLADATNFAFEQILKGADLPRPRADVKWERTQTTTEYIITGDLQSVFAPFDAMHHRAVMVDQRRQLCLCHAEFQPAAFDEFSINSHTIEGNTLFLPCQYHFVNFIKIS